MLHFGLAHPDEVMHTEHTHLPNERMRLAELNFIVAKEYVGGSVKHPVRLEFPTSCLASAPSEARPQSS